MPKFMLLLHDRPRAFAKMSPEDMQQVVQKYVAWGRKLRARRLLAESHKLTEDAGRVMRRARGRVLVTDGPYAESKELLGGYFIVKAKDYEAAAETARDCPHLDYGGTIEVRQVDQR
jgi:hypothetical protein